MIPFLRLTLGEDEIKAVADTIRSGWVVMGEKTLEFEEKFAQYVGSKYAVFVDSGTAALDLAVKYGKEFWNLKFLYAPSLTFTATAEVIVNNNLELRWLDVDAETFCVNSPYEETIKVHLAGREAKGKGCIEDSAHRIVKGQCRDSLGLVCFSFYATKNLTTIQGGMIATNDLLAYEWLKKARDHGISKGTTERYKQGAWQYSIDFIGWREKSDDVHAAIGLIQLEKLDRNNELRDRIVKRYNTFFDLNRQGNHLYPVLVKNRPEFINQLKEKEVQVSVHFLPLHKMPGYKKYSEGIRLPVTEYLGERMVSLPLYPSLLDTKVDYIAKCTLETDLLIKT